MKRKIKGIHLVIFPALLFFFGCRPNKKQDEKRSRVESFYYNGYGDSVFATLYGCVFEQSDTLLQLSGVKIMIVQNGKSVITNNKGEFSIGTEKGNFDIIISKEGYQSIKLRNYISDPDRVSSTKIILEKGKGERRKFV